MSFLIWFYLISVVLFYLMLIIDGRNYGVGVKNVFKYYGFDIIFMFIPLINVVIALLWIAVKLTNFDKNL